MLQLSVMHDYLGDKTLMKSTGGYIFDVMDNIIGRRSVIRLMNGVMAHWYQTHERSHESSTTSIPCQSCLA